MKIKIDDKYIKWIRKNAHFSHLTEKEITDYINEVLDNHRLSWEKNEG